MMQSRVIRPEAVPLQWVGPFILLAVIALLVVGAILVTRTIVNSRAPGGPAQAASSGPLLILEERFARGEIDEEEFRRRREILRS